MSIFEFRTTKEGDVNIGGIVRAPGEDEPLPQKMHGMNPEDVARNKAYEEKEIAFLSHMLDTTEFFGHKWTAGEVIKNPKVHDAVAKKLPEKFRYGKLDEHLKTLAMSTN